jgi:hypothetical protein
MREREREENLKSFCCYFAHSLLFVQAFVLNLHPHVYLYRGSKVSSDSEDFSMALALGARITVGAVLMVDQKDSSADEPFWGVFGAKFKINEPTPKEVCMRVVCVSFLCFESIVVDISKVIERYSSNRPPIWAIHPDKMMTEFPSSSLGELMGKTSLILVVDVFDDVVRSPRFLFVFVT